MGIIENVIKNVKKQYIKCNVCEKRGNVKVEFFTDYIKKTKEELICKNTEECHLTNHVFIFPEIFCAN